jgi:hypothetical protein
VADVVQVVAAMVDLLRAAFARHPATLAHLEHRLVVAWVCLFLYPARRVPVRVCPQAMYLVCQEVCLLAVAWRAVVLQAK